MKIAVRVKATGLRRKAAKVEAALAGEAEKALRELAVDAVRLLENASDREEVIARALTRQLAAVFEPVRLKHKRREAWPNLQPIYRARVIQGHTTYQGRKRFYVDENKEDALYRELLARALARNPVASYEVRFVVAYRGFFRVEIVKRRGGKMSRRDKVVMIAFARQRIKTVAADTMRRALSRSGLR